MSKSDLLFSVVTYKNLELETPFVYGKLRTYLQSDPIAFEKYIIVKESGANGNHEHLNIVVKLSMPRRTDTFSKSLFAKYSTPDKYTKNSVRTKVVHNLSQLLFGYLKKEDDAQILHNHKFDLKELQKSFQLVPVTYNKSTPVVSLNHAHFMLKEYADSNGLVIKDLETFKKVLFKAASVFSCINIRKNLKYVYWQYNAAFIKSYDDAEAQFIFD